MGGSSYMEPRYKQAAGKSDKTSTKHVYTLTEKEKLVCLSVDTNHPGKQSFQGMYREVLHPQLRLGLRLELNDVQFGMIWRMINEDRGRYGEVARRSLFRALTSRAGVEALEHAYHGTTDAWCSEFLIKLGELGAKHRKAALSVKEGHFAKEARENRIRDLDDGDNEGDYD